MVNKKTSKKAPLTLHGLLGALSYWGTSVRLFLAAFVSFAVFVVALSETDGSTRAVTGELIMLIYVLGSMLLLDFGYVLIARSLSLRRVLDVMCLLAVDLFLLGIYVGPKLIVSSSSTLVNPVGIAMLVAVLALSLRLLSGFLFSTKRKA